MLRLLPLAVVSVLRLGAAEYDDQASCQAARDANFQDRLATGAKWGECLEISVVLVNDPNHPLTQDYQDRSGMQGSPCVAGTVFQGAVPGEVSVTSPSDCPRGWNCNTDAQARVKACRNGLFCDSGSRTCEQCASCTGDEEYCGNCRTTFYPRVDDYSVLRLEDFCDLPGRHNTQEACNAQMGCVWVVDAGTTHCLPGPIPDQGDGQHTTLRLPRAVATAAGPADLDKHMVFTPGQEFYVEMGRDGVGNGVVRSPIVVFAQADGIEAVAMYLKLAMLNGYPRRISWEQTGKISPNCPMTDPQTGQVTNAPHVKYAASRRNERPHLWARCFSVASPSHCKDSVYQWPMTDCGFGTYDGHYDPDGKFAGMRWVDNTNATIPGGPAEDCSQDMCGTAPVKGEPVTPVQLYLTWTGTDVEARDMTSGGLTYEAFQQYSAFEAIQGVKNGAKALAEKSRQCVTLKDC